MPQLAACRSASYQSHVHEVTDTCYDESHDLTTGPLDPENLEGPGNASNAHTIIWLVFCVNFCLDFCSYKQINPGML